MHDGLGFTVASFVAWRTGAARLKGSTSEGLLAPPQATGKRGSVPVIGAEAGAEVTADPYAAYRSAPPEVTAPAADPYAAYRIGAAAANDEGEIIE